MWKYRKCEDTTATWDICAHIITLKRKLQEEYESGGFTQIPLRHGIEYENTTKAMEYVC